MADLKIIPNGYRKVYQVVEASKNCYRVVRILNEYETYEDAQEDLLDLLQHKKTEEDLLKEFKWE